MAQRFMAALTLQQAFDLAVEHHGAGRWGEAEQLYRQIVAQQPGHAEASHYLGVIAFQVGQHEVAAQWLRRALALRPHFPEAHYFLGMVLQGMGLLDEAVAAYRAALALRPGYVEARNNLGVALRLQGRLPEAIAAYRDAIALDPQLPEAHRNLGNALREDGQLEAAVAALRQAVKLRPDYAEALNNLGIALRALGQFEEVVGVFRQLVALRPGDAEAHNNLGNALRDAGEADAAIAAYRHAIQLRPGTAEARNNLGVTLKDLHRLDEAAAVFREALALNPQLPETHSNLACVLKDRGELDAAVAAFRHALALQPGLAVAHSDLAYTLHFHPGCDSRALAEEGRRWNDRHGVPRRAEIRPWANVPDPERRLKIGYVSPDFRDQAEVFFVAPLLAAHDHAQFEIHAYASVLQPDALTARLRGHADVWHDVVPDSDAQLATRIREDRIDVLVDLTMHMAGNRLLTFARKPAPVQVTWLAYPGGTGLTAIDYRLTDAFMDPPGAARDALYAERSVRLPDCWCCYDPLSAPLPIGPPPSVAAGHITFGSLNNFCKNNDPVWTLWAEVVRAVPGSRLLLLASEGECRRRARDFFAAHGVAPERLEFAATRPRPDYLRLYERIDIALDPFPYNGITTTCDALWMGVPVVTLAGETASSRAGLGLLTTAGLPELAAQTTGEFVQLAVALAGDAARRATLRADLRQQVGRSPLFDGPRFARNVEAAYREMWTQWCGAAASR